MIGDMKEGDFVSTFAQVEDSRLFGFKNKPGNYAVFTLSDKSGYIKGVCWNNGELYHRTVTDGSIIYIDGKVVQFNGQVQVNVEKLIAEPKQEHDPADFMQITPMDIDTMYQDVIDIIDAVKNPHLKKILESFFKDEDFAQGFKKCPAAKSVHHSYIGGLLEHTRNCAKLALALCELYPQLKRDLLVAGVLMHDMGKTVELSFDIKVDYTDRGRMLGHLVIGQNMILEKLNAMPDFPENLGVELMHLIVSHHGEGATGSPKRPKTAEACALHFLENLDAQTKRFIQIIEDTTNHMRNSKWTAYDRLLERYLYLGDGNYEGA